MKLTYEQYRMLAQLGPSNDRIIVKNKKGQIIKPNIKWENEHLKETRFMSSAVQPRPSHAPTASPLQTFHLASSPELRWPQGKR